MYRLSGPLVESYHQGVAWSCEGRLMPIKPVWNVDGRRARQPGQLQY